CACLFTDGGEQGVVLSVALRKRAGSRWAAILKTDATGTARKVFRGGMKGKKGTQFCLAAALSAVACLALPPTIGIASAFGTFTVNSTQVDGNANLFEGSEVKTGRASSQVLLRNGITFTLGINSSATIYSDHLTLQGGATRVDNLNGYSIHAEGYRIEGGQPASQAVVRLDGDMVEVAALAGSLNVFDSKGKLLTHIVTSTASAFQGGTGGGAGKSGVSPNNNNRIKYEAAAALLLAITLAGLGLAVASIEQSAPTSR
ncbi:MAG: hypothetical protein M3Y24_12025, partial [Acidobacteriota bacterium]|nr:hypothetical protein [Acidobacteriota bacterium]